MYSNTLAAPGDRDIIETKPRISINHFIEKLKRFRLYHRMLEIVTWKQSKNFHKEHFDRLVREVRYYAKKIQSE